MQVKRVQNNNNYSNSSNLYFGIKVGQEFITVTHNYYNYNVVANRLKNVHNFNEKVKQFEGFGHNDYTLTYERVKKYGNWQHYLYAVQDGTNKRIKIIPDRNNLTKVINKFLTMSRGEFESRFVNRK